MHHIRQRAGEALTHVRHFSSKVKNEQPEEPWVRSLDEHVQWEIKEEFEGRRLFRQSTDQTIRLYRDGSPTKEILSSSTEFTESDELKEITKELETTWKDAIKHLIKKREGKSNDLAELINDPTPKRLEAMVRRAAREVEAKAHTTGGKMRAEFRKLVARIENHKYLLDMLPSGDMYTSVLIGGFTACIKTTLEHEEIAGLISDCLEKLSDKTHKLYRAIRNPDRNEYIRAHIMKFYSTLFGLLVTILDRWLLSTAQRWKNSFGSSFQNQLRRSIDGLDYHVKELTDENSSLILQGVSNQVSQLGPMLQALLAGGIIDSSTGVYSGIPLTPKKTSASSMTPFAASQATLDSVSSLAASVASSMQDEQNDDYWTSQTILEDTAWMKEYVCSKREQYLLERSRYGSTDPQVYSRLLRWTQSSSSEALWLEGPSTLGDMTPNTLITACIVETFRRLDVPIISYFCHYDPRYYSTFSRPQELLKMVYSLTSQMLAFIPKDLSSALDAEDLPDFSPARIQRLSSDSGSLPDAIDFLRDIIPLAPPVLACCVDGLQILDSRDESRWYRDCLKSFIEVLGTTKPPEPRIMKLWLSTDGHSLTLQDAVNAGWIESDITNGEDDTEPLTIEQWM